jgi:LmbE family N-acetylglucosaminyl deacetylase
MFAPAVATVALAGFCAGAAPLSPPAIREELRKFGTFGTVLHIAAHPDDENTQLITYLARSRGYRTGYLSITRGDGGQNEMGPEFGALLGLARTQELLAARRIDGGRQFFTRALDFGYSKSVDETLTVWNRNQVVADVVRVIREFRPDVIVTRFPPEPSQTHGHHTASAVVALEAFKMAGDPKAFPEQLAQGLTPWQPLRIVQNGWRGEGGGITLLAGGEDAVTGEKFQAIAMRSRSQHKTQGFGLQPTGSGQWTETFRHLGGTPATTDLMDGIDTTWNRVPGAAEIASLIEKILGKFDEMNPAASVPALLDLRKRVISLNPDPVIADECVQLDKLLLACLGLTVESTPSAAEVVPGESFSVKSQVLRQAGLPVRWVGTRVTGLVTNTTKSELEPGEKAIRDLTVSVPASMPLTQPYWLRQEPTPGMFRVAETQWIGRPESPAAFTMEYDFEIDGQTLTMTDDLMAPSESGKPARPVAVISPVSLKFGSGVALVAPGESKTVQVAVTAARAGAAGTLHLETPPGWTVSPASQPFQTAEVGETATATFSVTAPPKPDSFTLRAIAEIGGEKFENARVVFDYGHIPIQVLQPMAGLKLVALDVAKRGNKVGYLPGAGDDIAEALEQLGYQVVTLAGADLTAANLSGLDAVVIGVRAFNVRADLAANLPGLFAYVEAGGTVIAQYNRPDGLKTQTLGPFDLSIAGAAPALRVTDENAPVTFLDPASPVLNVPNKIGPADFTGWVQERGAYFPSKWDEARYTPVLAMNDPGEPPLKGALLVANYGKGHFVYTGLAFFRQLPAGVPGAYRLFANLVSLGK